jgi:hypothetical protein
MVAQAGGEAYKQWSLNCIEAMGKNEVNIILK